MSHIFRLPTTRTYIYSGLYKLLKRASKKIFPHDIIIIINDYIMQIGNHIVKIRSSYEPSLVTEVIYRAKLDIFLLKCLRKE